MVSVHAAKEAEAIRFECKDKLVGNQEGDS